MIIIWNSIHVKKNPTNVITWLISMNEILTVVLTDRLIFQSQLYSPDYVHAYINNYDFRNLHYNCFLANDNFNQDQTFTLAHKSITPKQTIKKKHAESNVK